MHFRGRAAHRCDIFDASCLSGMLTDTTFAGSCHAELVQRLARTPRRHGFREPVCFLPRIHCAHCVAVLRLQTEQSYPDLQGCGCSVFWLDGHHLRLAHRVLSNDIWVRNKQAEHTTFVESDTLVALYSVSAASGADNQSLRSAMRAYVTAVVEHEWPRLAEQERSAQADAALNALLREVAVTGATRDPSVQRTMLDMALRVRTAHEDRVALSNDRTVVTKWLAVLLLALITQIAIAVVHLDRPRPQLAALMIFTLAAVSILGLLAIHEAPFEPPVFVPPGPIADVLKQVPM
jgi:hypothetical protein